MTVEELLGRMSSQELTDWAAVWELRSEEAQLQQARTDAARRARNMRG